MASIDMGDHTKRLAASSEAALEAGAEASSGPRQEDQKIFSILFNQARCLAFDTKNAGFLLSAKNSLVTSQNSALLTPQTTGALLTHSAVLRAFALAFLCCLLPACENGIVLDFKLFIKQKQRNAAIVPFGYIIEVRTIVVWDGRWGRCRCIDCTWRILLHRQGLVSGANAGRK